MRQITTATAALVCCLLSTQARAQTITFETLPGGAAPTDQMAISTQYQALGVTFSKEDGTFPHIARVGTPLTAFWGYQDIHDQPAPGTSVGQYFLTDNTSLGGANPPSPLIVDYVSPVAHASGELLDIDQNEQWTVQAFDTAGVQLGVVVLNPGSPGGGNGHAAPWRFDLGSPLIRRVRISYTGTTPGNIGLAFDNFNAGAPNTIFPPFCFGDGSQATPCPCAPPNVVPSPSGAAGHGCANSFDLGGAFLEASGTSSPDTVRLRALIGVGYGGFAVMVAGGASNSGFASGDGVICVSGQLLRFGAHSSGTDGDAFGSWTYPTVVHTTPVSVATAQPPASTAFYQLLYRNAAAGFCSDSTFNVSSGVQVSWP
jgi:hypothetical protein